MKKLVFLFLLVSVVFPGYAQIVDDSTKQVYGPFSVSRWYGTQREIKSSPDTLIRTFERMDTIARSNYQYVFLGNTGTAARFLGIRAGEEVWTPYFTSVHEVYALRKDQIQYYDTKSPYSNMEYWQGSRAIGRLTFTHSQNIKPEWNMTFWVNRLTSSKFFGLTGTSREERLADHWSSYLSTNYQKKNGNYRWQAHYYHFNHRQVETGGILPFETVPLSNQTLVPDYTDYQAQLQNVSSREYRNELYFHQEWKVAKNGGLLVFHTSDYRSNKYFNFDVNPALNALSPIYPSIPADLPDTLRVFNRWRTWINTVGVKGNWRGFAYELSGSPRIYRRVSPSHELVSSPWRTELGVGGKLGYFTPDSTWIIDFAGQLTTSGGLWTEAKASVKGWRLAYSQQRQPAGLFWSQWQNGYTQWNASWGAPFQQNISASLPMTRKIGTITPYAQYQLLFNHLYFDESSKPQQISAGISRLLTGISWVGRHAKFSWELSGEFQTTSRSDIIRIPTWHIHAHPAYQITWAKKLPISIGAHVYYKSAFAADVFQPMVGQFQLQSSQLVWGRPLIDAYTAFMINRVKLSFNFTHVNFGLLGNGFLVAPNQPLLPRAFNIHVNWPLFD